MDTTDTTNTNRRMVPGLVRRILLASAVIAGASCADHKPAQHGPETANAAGYDPYTTSAPRTAEAPPPVTDPTDPNGPSGPTQPTSPGDNAIPLQGPAAGPTGPIEPGQPRQPGAPRQPGGDEGSNRGGAGSPTAARDAGAPPTTGSGDAGTGGGSGGATSDGGAPRGNPRDGGVRSY